MRIVDGGSGSFLCPPGHPMLFQHIEAGRVDDPNMIAGLDYALDPKNTDVSAALRQRVRGIYAEATLVRSDLWERNVYGYFRNCYAPVGGSRNVSEAIIPRPGEPVPPIERHLAFLLVREYFPDAEPRPELLDQRNTLYGTRPCTKCERTLQYEATVDAFAEAITANLDCPSGGQHVADIPPIITEETA